MAAAKTTRQYHVELTEFPGEDFLAHAAALWKEQTAARLAEAGLLNTANGKEPAECKMITDIDLGAIPELPKDHRDYNRRQEARSRAQTQNAANLEARFSIEMQARTAVYAALKKCTEKSAPVLSRTLFDRCDLTKQYGLDMGVDGYYDGPLAYKIVLAHLNGDRTEEDKDYYRTAERLQRASALPDGALASEYVKKAMAFIIHIRPNLAQAYGDADASQWQEYPHHDDDRKLEPQEPTGASVEGAGRQDSHVPARAGGTRASAAGVLGQSLGPC